MAGLVTQHPGPGARLELLHTLVECVEKVAGALTNTSRLRHLPSWTPQTCGFRRVRGWVVPGVSWAAVPGTTMRLPPSMISPDPKVT